MDYGAQNLYNQPKLPAPYASTWYKELGIEYVCIDLNGENGALQIDLAYPIKEDLGQFDLVVDAGTTEHVGIDGKFSWEATYSAWLNKFNLCKIGGFIYSENPLTENWPGHGFAYHTEEFYKEISGRTLMPLLQLGKHPACNNTVDGWNVYSTLMKVSSDFISLEEFKELPIYQK